MRTFIIKARQTTTRWDQLQHQIGNKGHFEIIAHSVLNAFFVSNGFRDDVEVFIVLDSSKDFPRTLKLTSSISLSGFHETAILEVITQALKESARLKMDETQKIADGLEISGYGIETLVSCLIKTRPVYLLDPKGESLRTAKLLQDPVFLLSDHLALPKNLIKSFTRRGVEKISLGRKMLFASQCVTLIHYELDNNSLKMDNSHE